MINANNKTYTTGGTTANLVVTSKKAILERIIIGADVASSVIEVSDSADDGDGNVKVYLAGSTLLTATGGVVEVGAVFDNGITVDITNQTHVTFIWHATA